MKFREEARLEAVPFAFGAGFGIRSRERKIMIQLCRHILPAGVICNQSAVKNTLFCRHHAALKTAIAQCKPAPDPYGIHKPIPFVFPEDHAAIQLNLFMVLQALNDKSIDNRTANTMNRLLRSCEHNLGQTPLAGEGKENAVQRVILTPDGEEIAPPREALEEGENPPLHHKGCPCRKCAEQYRNATPEQHHANCQCGMCVESSDQEPESDQRSAFSDLESSDQRSAISDQLSDQRSAISDQEEPVGEHETEPAALNAERRSLYPALALNPVLRTASAQKLYNKELTRDPANKEVNVIDYLYGDHIRKYEAQYAARAAAAILEGIEPPPYEPFAVNKIELEGEKRYKATMEQVEKNKQIANEIWERRFGKEEPLQETKEESKAASINHEFDPTYKPIDLKEEARIAFANQPPDINPDLW